MAGIKTRVSNGMKNLFWRKPADSKANGNQKYAAILAAFAIAAVVIGGGSATWAYFSDATQETQNSVALADLKFNESIELEAISMLAMAPGDTANVSSSLLDWTPTDVPAALYLQISDIDCSTGVATFMTLDLNVNDAVVLSKNLTAIDNSTVVYLGNTKATDLVQTITISTLADNNVQGKACTWKEKAVLMQAVDKTYTGCSNVGDICA